MAEQIKSRGYDKLIILSCNNHRTLDQSSCAKYIEFYSELFSKFDIKVETQCNSILKDFALMVYSPLLVSLMQVVIHLWLALPKTRKIIFPAIWVYWKPGKYVLQENVDWVLDNRAPLLHKDVKDYNNTDEVIALLLQWDQASIATSRSSINT